MPAADDRRTRFEQLFAAHHRAVHGYVRRRAAAPAVEDVVAETFLVAWRRLDSIDEDALPWLLGVARRQLANQLRAQRRRDALTLRLTGLLPGHAAHRDPPHAMAPQLAAAMASLSAREREALLLVAWEGLEPGRAARAAGCSPAAFRVRLHRARQHVAARLQQGDPRSPRPPIAEEAS